MDPGLSGNDLSVTTSGVTTALNLVGAGIVAPSEAPVDVTSTSLLGVGVNSVDGLLSTLTGDGEASARSGGNHFYGSSGDDYLAASDNHDWLYGGAGSDTLQGGAGNDHIYGCQATGGMDGADSISAGAGNDYVQGNAGNDWISGGEGNDKIYGGQDADTIYGDAGNDSLNGNYGDDVLDGGAGDDWIRGGKGSDILSGGAGSDTLLGDLGSDTMTGGAGADVFRFAANDAAIVSTNALLFGNVDTIADFTPGEDHIALGFTPQSIVYGASSGTLADALAYATGLLSGHAGSGEVAAVSVGSDTVLFYNGAGGQLIDSVIDLHGVGSSSVTLADFI